MEHTFIFLILLGAGFLFRKIPAFPSSTDRSLNLYIIYIALPGLILARVPALQVSARILIPVTMAWVSVAASALAVLVVARVMKWSDNLVGALLLMVPLGNTSFLGIPMVEHFLGDEAIPHALIYDQFGTFMALSTYGAVILAVYGSGGKVTLKDILRKIFTFPPFLALCLALFLPPGIYPAWMVSLFEMTAASLVPVVLIAIGFAMELVLPRSETLPLIAGLCIKLLLIPCMMITCCMLLGFSGFVTRVSILETAMPPMVTAGALASIAGFEPRLTASMVGIGILVSFLTLPLVFRLSGF